MIALVSPYHLTTREAPAMAALLLGSEVVTYLPAPLGGQQMAKAAARCSPEYLRFIESWEWTGPLWQAGVLQRELADAQNPANDVHHAWNTLTTDARYASLSPLVRQDLYESEQSLLESISLDVLKGGPDPGVNIPLAAGLDRFAARCGLMMMRSHGNSVVQRTEKKLADIRASLAVPILLQASAERILRVRELLRNELVDFSQALDAFVHNEHTFAEIDPLAPPEDSTLTTDLRSAGRAYAQAFESRIQEIMRTDRHELHIVVRTASLQVVSLPTDTVLRSSLSAMQLLERTHTKPALHTTETPNTTMPILADTLGMHRVISLLVKPLGTKQR